MFLAFANDADAHLALLDQERKRICEWLIPLESKQHFQLYREPKTTIEEIKRYLIEFKNRVAIFHYGGHATSTKLMLEGQAANAAGVAELLKEQANLKLVFLNGCSTKAQVEYLLQLGTPAVIATSVPIEDTKAMEFSITFYEALTKQHTIREAFNVASATIKSIDGRETSVVSAGSDGSGGVLIPWGESPSDEIPWGLYLREGSEEVQHWKLPEKSHDQIVVRGPSERYNVNVVPVNETLTQALFDSLAEYSDELEFLAFQASKGKTIDVRKVRRAIMDSVPSPIGEHIRKLFAADPENIHVKLDTVGPERLKQLIVTYNAIVELLTFSMVAQLWDAVHEKGIEIGDNCKESIRSMLTVSGDERAVFNFFKVIGPILEELDRHEVPYFIEELQGLSKLFADEADLQQAYQFMEEIKGILHSGDKISGDEMESLCLQAEEKLSTLFKHFGFAAKYKLTTIKAIDLIKSRHRAPTYRHYKVSLDTVTAGYLDAEAVYTHFTDAKSVLLLKELDNVESYLSLSPFIIDENALKGEKKSKIFAFSHYDKARDVVVYHFMNNQSETLEITGDHFENLKEQFDDFSTLLFGTQLKLL